MVEANITMWAAEGEQAPFELLTVLPPPSSATPDLEDTIIAMETGLGMRLRATSLHSSHKLLLRRRSIQDLLLMLDTVSLL